MRLNLAHSGIKEPEYYSKDYQKRVQDIHAMLHANDHSAGTTWVDYPLTYDKKEFLKVLKLARDIEKTSEVLLVVGIGGSYLGAKSGIEMLAKKSKVEVQFAGINFDYVHLAEKLDSIKDKEITVNVVSKSGTTVEILSALHIVERWLKNKYKGDYKKHLIFTTDREKGYLRQRAIAEGIELLTVPDNMGGRYSVLSSVGMLPFACAGINIKKIMEGAVDAHRDLMKVDIESNPAYRYAIYRNLLYRKLNKQVELFSSFSSKLTSFGEWLTQLFNESEGKDGKGLFVTPIKFSTDLHSVGQFIQQGSPILAETFIDITTPPKDTELTGITLGSPIKFLDGKTYNQINRAAFEGTVKAHSEAGVPICIITFDEINEYNYGYMVYFFELACACSAKLLGVNPFNQPGVEQYKAYMKELLKNK